MPHNCKFPSNLTMIQSRICFQIVPGVFLAVAYLSNTTTALRLILSPSECLPTKDYLRFSADPIQKYSAAIIPMVYISVLVHAHVLPTSVQGQPGPPMYSFRIVSGLFPDCFRIVSGLFPARIPSKLQFNYNLITI